MYTFQNLNTAVKDKIWSDPDLGRRSTEKEVCAIERSYPKVSVYQILKRYLEYLSIHVHIQNLNAEHEHVFK